MSDQVTAILPHEAAQLVAYVLFGVGIIYLLVFSFTEGKSIKEGFKGKDKAWQFIEASGYIWMIIFSLTALLDVIGFHASTQLWASLDAIFLVAAGAKGYIHRTEKKYPTPPKNLDESI